LHRAGVVAVTVGTGIETVSVRVGLALRYLAVTVVVETVTLLGEAGVNEDAGVVTVITTLDARVAAYPAAHDKTVAIGIHFPSGDVAIAVVVDEVTDLCPASTYSSVAVIAVAATARQAIAVGVQLICGHASVAVVVQSVTDLSQRWRHQDVAVVAVTLAGRESVAVAIDLIGRHNGVAVVVEPVAGLGESGSDGRIGVIAVQPRAYIEAVAIGVCLIG